MDAVQEIQPLNWIRKRDGRLVPFETDKISRSLFAASEQLGKPDAFLARELADSIVHFLAADLDCNVPTTDLVAEHAIKVIRELGHSSLARCYADHASRRVESKALPSEGASLDRSHAQPAWIQDTGEAVAADSVAPALGRPRRLSRLAAEEPLRRFSLSQVYSRDLAAAHREGLIHLSGLEYPCQIEAAVLPDVPIDPQAAAERILAASEIIGQSIVLDGPEYNLAFSESPDHELPRLVRSIRFALETIPVQASIQLNCTLPPRHAVDQVAGPLFSKRTATIDRQMCTRLAQAILEEFLAPGLGDGQIHVDWHVSEADLQTGNSALAAVAEYVRTGKVAFVFDRPQSPICPGHGMDRDHPAVLLSVGLNMLGLVERMKTSHDPAVYLDKVASLVRLGLSAATQKREFLKRYAGRGAALPGFFLERARLVLRPVGLEQATRRLLGAGSWTEDASGLEYGRRVAQQMAGVAESEGRARLLESVLQIPPEDCGLDTSQDLALGSESMASRLDRGPEPTSRALPDVSIFPVPLSGQRIAVVWLPSQGEVRPPELLACLKTAWRMQDVMRLVVARAPGQHE